MPKRSEVGLDAFDVRLLKELAFDASQSNSTIGRKIGLFSPSAISKRKKGLFKRGMISGIKAHLIPEQCGLDYPVIILVRAKYGSNYIDALGSKLMGLPGILGVYNVSGDIDFLVFGVYKSRTEYLKVLDRLIGISEIERTDTRQVHKIIKDFDYSNVIASMEGE
jgi:Lrp/AsnC family transcriptional regulator for asnA, asnC and gidA